MNQIPLDPLAERGLQGYTEDFKSGRVSAEQTTAAYLARIDALDQKYHAFEHVAHESALATARAIDALRAAGTYLGPLMGVPIAIKDVFTITGMPAPKVGSKLDLTKLIGSIDGPFIEALRRAGCIFLGQTKAVELCLGITGVSAPLGTPWNASDTTYHRAPGGSSSGSGVAVAAGLCAFSIGSDSGGSIRVPAAYNGIFGLKTTTGLWPTAGAFPLDTRVDSIGLLTKTAADALIAFQTINSFLDGINRRVEVDPVNIDRLRLGVPQDYFYENLAPEVAQAVAGVNQALTHLGARLDKVDVPEAPEREGYFPVSMPASLLATLGVAEFEAQRHAMDPVVAKRVATGLEIKAHDYIRLEQKRQRSIANVENRFKGYDAWVSPTTVGYPPLLEEFDDPKAALALALGMTRNTQPGNYLELCAVSLPIPQSAGQLPIGYQIMGTGGSDARVLAIAVAVEKALGMNAGKAPNQ
jgi:aspartyl-tRNA(Asn)/glutamyl-tRNA(Gln) amidotransferase subunit A